MNTTFKITVNSLNIPSFKFIIDPNWTVEELKAHLKEIQEIGEKYIRIIFNGKILKEKEKLGHVGIKDESNIHISVTNSEPRSISSQSMNQINEDNSRGFDRLIEMGFSPQEVREARLQFYLSNIQNRLQNAQNNNIDNSNNNIDLIGIEDQWIDSQLPPQQETIEMENSQTQNQQQNFLQINDSIPEGTLYDLFFGILLGFLLSFIVLIWISDPKLSLKLKFGILAGIVCNAFFGLLIIIVK